MDGEPVYVKQLESLSFFHDGRMLGYCCVCDPEYPGSCDTCFYSSRREELEPCKSCVKGFQDSEGEESHGYKPSNYCFNCGRPITEHAKLSDRRKLEQLRTMVSWMHNPPLTLEELREMDGEPVWGEFPKCPEANEWMLVDATRHCVYNRWLGDCDFDNCGNTWMAYRRKPEEGCENAF